ncbi:glycosyltransferase involved in cell wall biosynthesis [Pontibacter ramchanderi]|uniref:Glycosyltransferase involved in cell wall biosynthesis n=2 Tax=Pontibacter ramchanderi TaxID=1179743 RepID=A0A2N3U7A2_9BACT|nr:glycosyltransferase involved in cell wall biosynthesis [Pontibacter ramchanderi]
MRHMDKEITFSVIIPVHNKLPHLERSVNSVLNQTHQNFELLLIDDASTDGSSEKLKTFRDPRIRLLRRDTPGPGGYAARNLGIATAQNNWVCFLDADDRWELTLLENLHNTLQQNRDIEIISWGWCKVSGSKKELDTFSKQNKKYSQRSFNLIDFLKGPQPMWTGAVSIKKKLLIESSGFPENGFKRGGDMDTWTRCLWRSSKCIWINKVLSYYHMDSVNMVTENVERDITFIFSPFLQDLLHTQNNTVKKAIKYYQNRYLYILLNGRVYERKSIRYDLVKKMNLNLQAVWLITKLHLNRVRHSF